MKLVASRQELVSLIQKVQNTISSKPSNPVLVNVLLQAIDDQLSLYTTDLTLSTKASMEANVLEEGKIALPAKQFFPLLREITTPYVEIHTISAETVEILAGGSRFKIQGVHADEFPDMPSIEPGQELVFSTNLLKELLCKTIFAIGKEETRPTLCGIHIQTEGTAVIFTGTDGKKLAKVEAELLSSSLPQSSFILPAKTAEEIIRLLDTKEETVSIHLLQDKIFMHVGSLTLLSHLIPGQYPDVNRVIPVTPRTPILLHREELIALLRQIALFTEGRSVKFSFIPGELHLCAANGLTGEGKVSMPMNYAGSPMDIAFNPTFFLDVLRHSKDEAITLDIGNSYTPGLISDSSKARFILMPMKLES